MKKVLQLIVGLAASILAGYVTLNPPDFVIKNPDVSLKLFILLAIILVIIEVSLLERKQTKRKIHIVEAAPFTKEKVIGRDHQKADLAQHIKSKTKIISIEGEPGVGKSAIISHFVKKKKKRYGFIAWQSLYDEPTVKEVVNSWLKGFDESTPEIALNSRIDFFLKKLENTKPKRALIVFDHADSVFEYDPKGKKTIFPDEYKRFIMRLAKYDKVKFTIIITSSISLDTDDFRVNNILCKSIVVEGLNNSELDIVIKERTGRKIENEIIYELSSGNISVALLLMELANDDEIIDSTKGVAGRLLERLIRTHLNDLDMEQLALLTFLSIVRMPLSIEEIENSLISMNSLRGTIRNSIRELKSKYLVTLVEEDKYMSLPMVSEVIAEDVVCEMTDVFLRHSIDNANIISLVPLEHSFWSDDLRRNTKYSIYVSLKNRIKENYNKDFIDFAQDEIQELINLVTSDDKTNTMLSNIVNYLIYLELDFSGLDFDHGYLTGVDFTRIHLFDVKMRNTFLKDCQFADRTGPIYCVKFFDDNKLLVGLSSGSVELRNANNLYRIRRIEAHSEPVRSVIAIKNKGLIISAGEDGRINVYNDELTDLIKSHRLHDCWVWKLIYVEEKEIVLSIASDGSIGVLNLCNTEVVGKITVPSRRLWDGCLINEMIYIASEDGILWSVNISDAIFSIEKNIVPKWNSIANVNDPIKCCCATQENILFGCRNGKLYMYSLNDKSLKILSIEDSCIRDIIISSNHINLYSVGDSGKVRNYNISEGNLISEFKVQSSRTWSIDIRNDGTAVSCGDDRTIKLWDSNTDTSIRASFGHGQTLRKIDILDDKMFLACADDFLRVGLFSNGKLGFTSETTFRKGKRILGVSLMRNDTWYCTFEDGEVLHINEKGVLNSEFIHSGSIECITRNLLADKIATGGEDRRIVIHDEEFNKHQEPQEFHSSRVWSLDFSPNGEKVASAGGDFIVAAWKTESGEILWSRPGHNNLILAVKWINNDSIVTGGTDGTIRIWSNGNCTSIKNVSCVIRSITVDDEGVIYAIGRRDDSIPGWRMVVWNENIDMIQEIDLEMFGGSAKSIHYHNGMLYAGGDLPFLLTIDPKSFEIINKSRIPGPYSGLELTECKVIGADLESISLLGAKLF